MTYKSPTEVVHFYEPHSAVVVRTHDGGRKDVCTCMLRRLHKHEIKNGTVPDHMPELDEPKGAGCHPDWRRD